MFTTRAKQGYWGRAFVIVRSLAACPCWACRAGRRRVLSRLAWLAIVMLLAAGHAAHVLPAELERAPGRLAGALLADARDPR